MSHADHTAHIPLFAIATADAPAAARRKRVGIGARQFILLSWIAPVLLLAVWEILAQTGYVTPQVLPAPSKVVRTAFKLATSGSLLEDLGTSLLRAAAGFAIGGSIAFVLGVLVGFSRLAEALVDRSVQMVRAIPFLALLPLVIVWFGVGEGQKVFLVALGVAFPIYINTTLGIRQVEPKLLELGRVQGLSTAQTIWRIILPGALPSIRDRRARIRWPPLGWRWWWRRPSVLRRESAFLPWMPANSCAPTWWC